MDDNELYMTQGRYGRGTSRPGTLSTIEHMLTGGVAGRSNVLWDSERDRENRLATQMAIQNAAGRDEYRGLTPLIVDRTRGLNQADIDHQRAMVPVSAEGITANGAANLGVKKNEDAYSKDLIMQQLKAAHPNLSPEEHEALYSQFTGVPTKAAENTAAQAQAENKTNRARGSAKSQFEIGAAEGTDDLASTRAHTSQANLNRSRDEASSVIESGPDFNDYLKMAANLNLNKTKLADQQTMRDLTVHNATEQLDPTGSITAGRDQARGGLLPIPRDSRLMHLDSGQIDEPSKYIHMRSQIDNPNGWGQPITQESLFDTSNNAFVTPTGRIPLNTNTLSGQLGPNPLNSLQGAPTNATGTMRIKPRK